MKYTKYFFPGFLILTLCVCLCGNTHAQAFKELGAGSIPRTTIELGMNNDNYSTPSRTFSVTSVQLSGIKINRDETADNSSETIDYSSLINSAEDLTKLTYPSLDEFNRALDYYLLNVSATDNAFTVVVSMSQNEDHALYDVYEQGEYRSHSFVFSEGNVYSQ